MSPVLNHYKARFLNHLSKNSNIKLTVIAGSGRKNMGDIDETGKMKYRIIRSDISKDDFGKSRDIRKLLKKQFAKHDWVLIPKEKKNLILIIYAVWLRSIYSIKFQSIKIISYNHPVLKNKKGKYKIIDKLIANILYKLYDRIIFYTKHSCKEMTEERIISKRKAFYANNTIYTKDVDNNYSFEYPKKDNYTILFIGRLIENKKIPTLFDYYFELLRKINTINKKLNLIIIGDGPERNIVKKYIHANFRIKWVGAIINESEIAPYMKRANIVFNPGHSGLSINHAFCYGRPYITIKSNTHAPEINYLKDGYNGFILTGERESDINKLYSILISNNNKIYYNAYQTGKYLSIDNWCQKIIFALK